MAGISTPREDVARVSEPKEFQGKSRSEIVAALVQEREQSQQALAKLQRELEQSDRSYDNMLDVLRLSWKESDALKEEARERKPCGCCLPIEPLVPGLIDHVPNRRKVKDFGYAKGAPLPLHKRWVKPWCAHDWVPGGTETQEEGARRWREELGNAVLHPRLRRAWGYRKLPSCHAAPVVVLLYPRP